MPSASKQQQKLMGIVHALQKGDMKPSQASGKAKEMAKSMKKGDVKDFASTKHKGLPKKVKKEDYNPTKMYVVVKPSDNMDASGMVMELNPLLGIQPLNLDMANVHTVAADETQAREIAAEAYGKYCSEVQALEEKKGKVGDKLKKTIDHLEKKRKEHIDMAKEDPKSSSEHKEHIAKLATQIDDLMSKMEKIERSKKNVEKKEDKKDVEKKDLKESNKKDDYKIGEEIMGTKKNYFLYNQETGKKEGLYKTKEEAQKALEKKDLKESSLNIGDNLKVGDKFIKIGNYKQVLTIKKIEGDKVFVESDIMPGKLWQWPKEIFDADVKSGNLKWQPKQD